MTKSQTEVLTDAQYELYDWIKYYVKEFQHSPSIRQMMEAMNLRSPAPIQSRLKHLQEKGYISWQEGKARTLQIIDEMISTIPIMGSIAAGGLVEPFSDCTEELDFSNIFSKKDIFALTVNGDSMIDACISNGDIVLIEPIKDIHALRNGMIVSALVSGLGTTLKYFSRKDNKIYLDPANKNYEPIVLDEDQVHIQGKLLGVWRQT